LLAGCDGPSLYTHSLPFSFSFFPPYHPIHPSPL
jgi:hypothetical protein